MLSPAPWSWRDAQSQFAYKERMMQHELERARLKAGKVPNVGQEGHSMNAYSSSTDVNSFLKIRFLSVQL